MTTSTTQPDASGSRRIVVVDDHGLLAQSLAFALRQVGLPTDVCGDITETAIMDATTCPPADAVLLDLDLGGPLGSALPFIPRLAELDVRVLVLTGVTDRLRLAECVEAGAVGIVSKTRPFDALVEDVLRAIEGRTLFAPGERQAYLADLHRLRRQNEAALAPFARLTPRERFVLGRVVDGHSAEQIAQSAVVSKATIRSQIHSVLQKLGVNSQLAAVALTRRVGWEPIDD